MPNSFYFDPQDVLRYVSEAHEPPRLLEPTSISVYRPANYSQAAFESVKHQPRLRSFGIVVSNGDHEFHAAYTYEKLGGIVFECPKSKKDLQ